MIIERTTDINIRQSVRKVGDYIGFGICVLVMILMTLKYYGIIK